MKKTKKSYFKGKVAGNAKKQGQRNNNFGYLNLPQGVEMFKEVPGGKTKIDIMPYEVTIGNHPDHLMDEDCASKGDLWYRLPFYIHRNIGTAKDTVVCPATFGKKCPICDQRNMLFKEKASKDETDLLKRSLRNLYIVIPIGQSKFEEKPYIWDISQALFQNLLNEEIQENEDFENFPDLEDGWSLKVRFEEKTFAGNSYAEASRIDFEKRKKGYDESMLEEVPCLDNLLKVLDFETLKAKFYELEDEPTDDDEEDDDDEPAQKRTSKSTSTGKTKSKTVEPEPEEDEDEDEDDEPEMSYSDLSNMTGKQLKKLIKEQDLDVDPDDYDDDEELVEAIAEELGIEKPKKKAAPKAAPKKEEKTSRRKPAPEPEEDDDDDDDEDDLPFKNDKAKVTKTKEVEKEMRAGTMVKAEWGECEIVAINRDAMTCTLADQKGKRHVGVPFHKMSVISYGNPGHPGRITKKEQEKSQKNSCPFKHRFGVDTDEFDDCEDCQKWNDCMDEKEKN